jgi:cystathionine beta-lyase
VVPYDLRSIRSMSSPQMLQGGFVRLSVGLEAAEDLIADLAQALAQAAI